MANSIIIGAQWGDEGKGKIVDILAKKMDVVVRFQGGANAGHTIVGNGRKIVLHLVPSGILSRKCRNVIGNGCVVDVALLTEEIAGLEKEGFPVTEENLVIAPNAHIVTPMHRIFDRATGGKVGTTGRGIGPCYFDKAKRTGIRAEDLAEGCFREKFLELYDYYASQMKLFSKEKMPSSKELFDSVKKPAAFVAKFVGDAQTMIHEAARSGKEILFEGAQGTFLDVDHGTYPFVTSSNTTIGGAYTGSGVFLEFSKRIAIVKAYTTRVGNGPFPTEQDNADGENLRKIGAEYGATTGRPRRCGWLDLALLEKSFMINGFNSIALTKLDCLSGLEKIPVALSYGTDGKPYYQDFPGWMTPLRGIKSYAKLPSKCRDYVKFVEAYLGAPAEIISTGPDRKDTIVR